MKALTLSTLLVVINAATTHAADYECPAHSQISDSDNPEYFIRILYTNDMMTFEFYGAFEYSGPVDIGGGMFEYSRNFHSIGGPIFPDDLTVFGDVRVSNNGLPIEYVETRAYILAP